MDGREVMPVRSLRPLLLDDERIFLADNKPSPTIFETPDPAATLRKCRRSYQVYGGEIANARLGIAMTDTATQALLDFRFDETRTVAPTVTLPGDPSADYEIRASAGGVVPPTGFVVTDVDRRSAQIRLAVAAGLTAPGAVSFKSKTISGKIVVDARY